MSSAVSADHITERQKMEAYWKGYSEHKNIETMMLDTNAATLHKEEKPEIMAMLPELRGKDILELAAGIGRYTEALIETKPQSLLGVEFIREFHEENEKNNASGNDNISLMCEDVTKLELPHSSRDVVFSNWLLMYLSDGEVSSLIKKVLGWVRPGGHAFFRESCFERSGNMKRGENPTHYRHPRFYIGLFRSICLKEEDGSISSFELISSRSVSAYRKLKNNHGQICFLWQKVTHKESPEKSIQSFQKFLDEQQYSSISIRRYEKIFGAGYVSTGGQETTTEFVAKLELKEGSKVLDVGCGIGGGDFYMAKAFGAHVTGIDLSTNMVHTALERAIAQGEQTVEFEICDATKKDFPEGTFDVVYSRDTILHIQDKHALFSKFLKWLKPGGKLLISDYCCGDLPHSEHFKEYVESRGYHLLSPAQYGHVLESVGFCQVNAEDRTDQFVKILREELERTLASRDVFISETSLDDYEAIVNGWKAKLERCAHGDQKWGLFTATKPLQ